MMCLPVLYKNRYFYIKCRDVMCMPLFVVVVIIYVFFVVCRYGYTVTLQFM